MRLAACGCAEGGQRAMARSEKKPSDERDIGIQCWSFAEEGEEDFLRDVFGELLLFDETPRVGVDEAGMARDKLGKKVVRGGALVGDEEFTVGHEWIRRS